MNAWKPITNKTEIGEGSEKVESSEFFNYLIAFPGELCNLTTCRYNKNGKCTSEADREICVDVAKKVLCVRESETSDKM